MSDAFNTIRKVSLPIPLLEKVKARTLLNGERCFKPHAIVDLVMERIKEFDITAVHVSDAGGFRDFLSTAYSSETESMVFCFKPRYWEELNALQNRLNISTGDLMRLVICSCLYPSGKTALPLKDLAAVFTERKAYQYNLLLTRPVMELLSNSARHGLSVNREVIIRAAHFYYASGLWVKPPLENEPLHRVDNTATGWSRLTVMGSLAMKNYYLDGKKRTGKTLAVLMKNPEASSRLLRWRGNLLYRRGPYPNAGIVCKIFPVAANFPEQAPGYGPRLPISHTLYSFLNDMRREAGTEKEKENRNQGQGVEIIVKAIVAYLTRDVTDESLLIAKMSEIIRVVQNMSVKLDAGQKLVFQYFFLFAPDFPADEQEKQRMYNKGASRTQSFLAGFRQREKQMPRLLEAIFGMMLEEEKE
jgi:hypothetical protein